MMCAEWYLEETKEVTLERVPAHQCLESKQEIQAMCQSSSAPNLTKAMNQEKGLINYRCPPFPSP
jgi:hypothetical protein